MALVSGSHSETLYAARQDIQVCFHQDRILESLSQTFPFLLVPASELGLADVDGVPCLSCDLVYLCCSTLPKGFALSAFWAQTIQESILSEVGCTPEDQHRDHAPSPFMSDGDHVAYLGNEAMVGTDGTQCNRKLTVARDRLVQAGLPIHEEASASTDQILLGIHLEGGRGEVWVAHGRFWQIRQAMEALLKRSVVSGASVEIADIAEHI